MRILYFDIDGTLLDLDGSPKAALVNGALEARLKRLEFASLVCVSGWVDCFSLDVRHLSPAEQRLCLHRLLASIFPDKSWFLPRLLLGSDTDNRCRDMDFKSDWYYVDDLARRFFTAEFGVAEYHANNGLRILQVDPYGDGNDILSWLDTVEANFNGS